MLAITRRKNEIVRLIDRHTGRELGTVMILDASPSGRVRIGFDFDSSVEIVRNELPDREAAAHNPQPKAC